ncbi:MAG TPA: efflux RND transporter permease subunit, partial [Candidatus Eremiobacteraceae bacterium]|nr:efflux RND transporter permease subunit [Candidatus Eremiobacteraceae bacterium]
MWLTRFALKQPTIVTLFFIAIALFGTIGFFSMGRNIDPSVTFPAVTVVADYSGASPEEMERLIVRPIEDQLQGVSHIEQVFSRSTEGEATIEVQFKLGTDINSASNDVQQALDQARSFQPADLNPPLLFKEDTTSSPILQEAVTSTSLSPTQLSALVESEIIPALRAVKGVGAVNPSGEFTREIHINPDPARLAGVGATLLDVSNAVGAGNVSMPGGRLDLGATEATMGIRADITDPSQIAQIPLQIPNGSNQLRVGDVATVSDTHADQRLTAKVDGIPAIVLAVGHDNDADTAKTTQGIRAAFADLAARYPQAHFVEIEADNDFLHEAVSGVMQNLFEGILLTAVVLLLFLHVWRSALVVMIAIPSSLLATFFVMWSLGFSIDLLSLMGLSLTIGILVDDSIVVIENITRHREMGKRPDDAAITGRTEIGGAAIAITLVDVVVFAPIAFMSGIVGEFLREYGLVIVCSTLFSLLVSFTLTPLLAARWAVLRKPRAPRARFIRAFTERFETIRDAYHQRVLPAALRRPWLIGVGSLALVIVSIVVGLIIVPTEFQPNTEYGSAIATLTYPIGTSIATTQAGADRLAAAFQHAPGVKDTVVTVGGDGSYTAQVEVDLDPAHRHDEHVIVDKMNQMSDLVPGALLVAGGAMNGGGADLTYTLSGPTDEIDGAAKKLADYIKTLPNTTGVNSTAQMTGPRLEVRIDRVKAALLGVSPQDAATVARAAVGGVIATKVRTDDGLIDALVQLPPATRNDVESLKTVEVRSNNGTLIPLADVASFNWVSEPPVLRRIDRERIVRVFANMKGGAPIGPVDNKVKAILAMPNFLPSGVHVKSEGSADLLQDSMNKIGIALLTSFVLIYMLLVVLYRNYLSPLVIMVSIPVALVGALGALTISNLLHGAFPDVRYFGGQTLNIFSMLGIVMLMGLVAKNGILLVDYANTLHAKGLALKDAIVESASVRFRPIVMTTAAMIFGMLP